MLLSRLIRHGRLGCLGLLFACESPSTTFDAFPVRHPQNLERKLGSHIQLISVRDTLQLQVHFDAASRQNIFTQESIHDTLLAAWALRHHQLYYLVQPRPDSGYWVHAARIRGNEVQGLATGWEQMMDVSEVVKQGKFASLVRYRSLAGDSSRIKFDARQLQEFYKAELDSFPVYHLTPFGAAQQQLASTVDADRPTLYPNPAQDYTTLQFAGPGQRSVQVLATNGQCLYRSETQEQTVTLPLKALPVGHYYVKVMGAAGKATTTQQLQIQR